MKTKKVYPRRPNQPPFTWEDVVDGKGNIIATISSTQDEGNVEVGMTKECVYFDSEGYPEIIVSGRLIDFEAMQRGLKLLEKDPRNRYAYKLIRKNYVELIE